MVIHSHLKHPNIVTFLGASFGKGALYIVTEYIHGANLEDVIFDVNEREKYPALSTPRKHNIATNISQAIGYLHGNNPCVLHCDIKPANILVSQSFDVVKLCDLDISKVRTMERKTITTSNKDVIPGTPSYTAPEILLRGEKTTTATDIWSLGCTLIELMTGE